MFGVQSLSQGNKRRFTMRSKSPKGHASVTDAGRFMQITMGWLIYA